MFYLILFKNAIIKPIQIHAIIGNSNIRSNKSGILTAIRNSIKTDVNILNKFTNRFIKAINIAIPSRIVIMYVIIAKIKKRTVIKLFLIYI